MSNARGTTTSLVQVEMENKRQRSRSLLRKDVGTHGELTASRKDIPTAVIVNELVGLISHSFEDMGDWYIDQFD